MAVETFERRTRLPAPVDVVFGWHARPGAFERLSPPWERVDVLSREGDLRDGTVRLRLRTAAFTTLWTARHEGYEENVRFRDVQVAGPFRRWVHTHSFEPETDETSWLTDTVEYELPYGPLGRLVGGGLVRRRLARLFAHRHRLMLNDVALASQTQPLTIVVTGATGLVGSALVPFLTTLGHTVRRLGRGPAQAPDQFSWDPLAGTVQAGALEGADAVIHLAGEPLGRRWNPALQERIRASREQGTRTLAAALARLETPPKVLLSTSAIGYYGSCGDKRLKEGDPRGTGFLADVCEAWEAAAEPARAAGVRVVHPRLGMVLSPRGGALGQMLTPFLLGVGGPLGSGAQYWSWIGLEDTLSALHWLLTAADVSGPVNLVAPQALTNAEFTRTLARVLHRPALLPAPAAALRLALGGMADELLLASARVQPTKLVSAGFKFRQPDLETALSQMLGL